MAKRKRIKRISIENSEEVLITTTIQKMIIHPCAKINLGLNVTAKRSDGYHDIETVFLPVPIYDTLEVHTLPEEYTTDAPYILDITGNEIVCNAEDNLVVKAYRLLANDFPLPKVMIRLRKDIPSQAGMGGGSSDAAYMLRLLNEEYHLNIPINGLQTYAARLGADCAFFITADAEHPQPIYATGIGEKLYPLQQHWNVLDNKWIAFIKPNVAVSTREAYSGITPSMPSKNCLDILLQPIETWRDELHNDFEDSIFSKLPVLEKTKEYLYNQGAIYAAMSGSGSTIFGIFNDKPDITSDAWHFITHL